jgi:hypothetical protein
VNYELVELQGLSGSRATIYSVIMAGDNITLFDHFVNESLIGHQKEIRFIASRLKEIGNSTGAREQFFKHNEGKPGDGVCALYDDPDSKLRLYCVRYGNTAVILGGGGQKPDNIKAWQDDEKLTLEAETIIQISKDILHRIRSGDLQWSKDGSKLFGNLIISDDDE